MKKYAVFTNTEFVPTHELSVSNKIIEKEDPVVILQIISEWIKEIYPDAMVYYKGDISSVDALSVVRINTVGDNTGLVVYHKESNVRIRVGFFTKTYETHEVK